MFERFRTWLNEPVDAAALAAFRVAVGVMVTVSAVRFIVYGWVDDFFVKPTFFFKHMGFAWVPVPSSTTVHALFWLLVVLGVLVTLGLFYRVAIVALFVGFTWVQLMDATNYLNHYYLVSLLLLLLSTMPLGDAYGLDGRRRRTTRTTLPRWMTVVLRLQVGCVYFYAGLAKLDADWLLHAQPLGIWLTSRTSMPLVGPLLAQWWAPWLFSWCGFLFDTSIVFLLLWSRTRPLAYVAVVVFHSLTMALFPIGMFPVIMMVAALVFFSSSWPRRFLRLAPVTTTTTTTTKPLALPTTTALLLWATFHLLMPLRGWLYDGNVRWHEQGMRFSWRVMVREKNGTVTFHLEDKATGRRWFVRPRQWLDARQDREFSTQPDLILQLAKHIAAEERAKGRDVAVRAEALVSLNGRRASLLIEPTVDLTTVDDGVLPASWITTTPTTAPSPAPAPLPPRR